MVEGPNFVNPVPVSAATPTRPSAPPTARCLSDTCVLQGRPECFDYCLPCARRLGLVDSNFTLPSVATPARSTPPPAPATAPEGGSCRGQCGFFGAPERCGLCSSCFAKIRDDSYLVALAGAVVNRVEAVTQYVALGGSLKRCVTSAEADVLRSLHFYVADGASLSKIAHECNSNEVLMYVLSEDQGSPADEAYKRKTLSSLLPAGPAEWGGNGADNDEEPAIADDVRLEFISTQQRRDDGLVYYDPTAAAGTATTKIASCFVLPPALSAMPHDVRVAHLHHYQEQPEMLSDITKATAFFSAVPQCSQLFPVYTVADLNCLLHSAFTSMLGVRDGILASDDPTSSRATTRTVLRESMRNSLRECNILQAAVAPSTAPDASVLDVDHTRLEQVLHDIELGKASLDGGHVFTLANVLRRPIVVWAQVEIEGSFRHVLRVPFRASGIYLPLLWKPDEVLLDPLYLCYSSGHFSSLVGFANESNDDCDEQTSHVYRVVAPLCDEQFVPLPIHFADSPVVVELLESRGLPRIVMMPEEAKTRHSPAEMALLSAYIRLAGTAKLMDDDDDSAPIITLAEQWVPKDASQTTRSPTQTQQYTEHLWKALAELTASKPVNPPRRAADADDVYDV